MTPQLDSGYGGEITASGDFNLHGVTKTISETGKITIKEGTIRLEVSFTNIAWKDYNIDIPKIVMKT
ncbi:MAG: hypothetical protein IPN36_06905 [Bacteroidetes bacterium]|nr:hypothetical protein [Bacteroidota bacterium]